MISRSCIYIMKEGLKSDKEQITFAEIMSCKASAEVFNIVCPLTCHNNTVFSFCRFNKISSP